MENNPNNRPDSYNTTNEDRQDLQQKNKLITYLLGVLGAVVIAVILYFALSGESNYENGVKYLKQKQYTEALVEFQKVDPGDSEFRMAQSKINYINGLRAFNENMYPQAKLFLTKVDPADEYYRESQLMIDKMNLASRQQINLESLSGQVNTRKDTVIIKEKVVETQPPTTINEASPNPDTKNNGAYLLKLESLISKFESQYQAALKGNMESKKTHLKYMDSLYNEFTKLSTSSNNDEVGDLNKMTVSWMQKRQNFVSLLISDNSVSETSSTRALKEEGDREYSLLLSRLRL